MIAWGLIAVVGGIVCTVLDHLHVVYGVLWYPKPVVWQQAWWVPLLFTGATLACVGGVRVIRKAMRGAPIERPTVGLLLADLIAFVTAYSFSSFAAPLPNVILGVNLAYWLARVLRGTRSWVVVYSLVAALGGTLFEAGFSGLGFFYYHHPDFIGVARWLPTIYLHAGLLGTTIERMLEAERV